MSTQTESLGKCHKRFIPSRQHSRILAFIEGSGVAQTRSDIEKGTGIKITSLCARIKELVDQGILTVPHTVYDKDTNREVNAYKVVV